MTATSRKHPSRTPRPVARRSRATETPQRTTVFQNGNSQAIRIPKNLRLDCSAATIRRVGSTLVIEPAEPSTWDEYFATIEPESTLERPAQPPMPQIRRWNERGDERR